MAKVEATEMGWRKRLIDFLQEWGDSLNEDALTSEYSLDMPITDNVSIHFELRLKVNTDRT